LFRRDFAAVTDRINPVTLTGSYVVPTAGVWTVTMGIGGLTSVDSDPANPWNIRASQRFLTVQWLKR
jgi:hypothetical protein